MTQDERLFGAPNRFIAVLGITLMRPAGQAEVVVVECQAVARKRGHRIHVTIHEGGSASTVLGLVAPLIHLHYVAPSTWAHHAARVADRLMAEGYEVSLT